MAHARSRLWSVVLLAACSTGDPAAPSVTPAPAPARPAPAASAESVSFHRDVEPLLEAHCLKCHQPGGIAPFSLTTYDDARRMAAAIVSETGARRMPPWGARETSDCRPRLAWKGDERLTDPEIATIAAWNAAGAPEGDAPAMPPHPPRRLALEHVTLTLAPRAPFVASGSTDQYRCFVLDAPELAGGAWVTGIDVVPGERSVVHHAVVLSDTKGTFAAKAGDDGSFECAGMSDDGSGTDHTLLEVWVPGAYPIDLPADMAMRIEPGAKVVMRVHYSPGGRTAAPDTTKVQLRLAKAKPAYVLSTMEIGNAASAADGLLPGPDDEHGVEFRIPANVHDHVETMRLPFKRARGTGASGPVHVYGVMGHEHLAGIEVKVDLEHQGDRQCLLDEAWDFHWQRLYTYAASPESLPTIAPGDTITLRCTYDNSMANRRLGPEYEARGLVPLDIHLGEQTLDEMCLFIPMLLERNP